MERRFVDGRLKAFHSYYDHEVKRIDENSLDPTVMDELDCVRPATCWLIVECTAERISSREKCAGT